MGSGPAGLSAALYAARAGLHPLIITGVPFGGQLLRTQSIKNWPGIPEISGPDLINNLHAHVAHYPSDFLIDEVINVSLSSEEKKLTLASGTILTTQALIIACGGKPKKLTCPGAENYANRGIYSEVPQDATAYTQKKVVVVGGGNSAITFAAHLLKIGAHVTIIQSLDSLTATDPLTHTVRTHPHATILCHRSVHMVAGTIANVTEITVQHIGTQEYTTLPTEAIFVAIGSGPNTELFKGQLDINTHNRLVIQPGTSLTSMPGIFAAGDICDSRYRHAITSAGQGCMAALDAELYLNGKVVVRFY
ncbi:MAG: thioredoxin reductase [Candidatus Dependentiae bacterium]|nr:thioredoxin reductase [Candidatus Dependentiae bacterium]